VSKRLDFPSEERNTLKSPLSPPDFQEPSKMRIRMPQVILASTVLCATLSLMAFDAPARQNRGTQSVVRVIDPLRPWQHANGQIEH
jgi:hypothetical protein